MTSFVMQTVQLKRPFMVRWFDKLTITTNGNMSSYR